MSGLQIGDPAPDFSLEGPDGTFTLSEHRGERVVVLFYPGDDTTVCTKQFCSYRDAGDRIAELDATLVGISTQDVASKIAFKAKHGLTTCLVADPDGATATAYGVYAKRLRMAKRTAFIVDEDGRVAYRHANFASLTYDDADDLRAALARLPRGTGP
jgi:peroxiredoxin Q/BCP